jgi:hypothetical protein
LVLIFLHVITTHLVDGDDHNQPGSVDLRGWRDCAGEPKN